MTATSIDACATIGVEREGSTGLNGGPLAFGTPFLGQNQALGEFGGLPR